MSRSADLAIIGNGALGIGLAVLAAEARLEVACYGRAGARPSGTLHDPDSMRTATFVEATSARVTLLVVKTYGLVEALRIHANLLSHSDHVVVIRNGLSMEALASHPSSARAIAWACAERTGRDEARWWTSARLALRAGAVAASLEAVLSGVAQVQVDVVSGPQLEAWNYEKGMISAGLNAITAAYAIAPGALLLDPDRRAQAIAVAREIAEWPASL